MNVFGLVSWTIVLIMTCFVYVPQLFKSDFFGFNTHDSMFITILYVLSLLANILFCLK